MDCPLSTYPLVYPQFHPVQFHVTHKTTALINKTRKQPSSCYNLHMKESFESNSPLFTFPSIAEESGEFARVAETFDIDSSVLMFLAQDGELISLDENM